MKRLIPEEIRDYISYNPDTGDLTWIKRASNAVVSGDCAGGINSRGYAMTVFKGLAYLSHRIAWFLHTGEQPPEQIDHIDNNQLNNRFNNLREATKSQNQHNARKRCDNTSGYKGVSRHSRNNKWIATIKLSNKIHYLGSFSNPKEAHQAYCKAADKLHKQFKNYGDKS